MALFDGLLPALDWLRLPIPLGGTSTHFPTEVVKRAGGWDPHNVTEDADLGMRLARQGYVCRTIPSRTYEEAPFRLGSWIRQRTRWIKGWMQTLLVHTRRPVRLVREMGALLQLMTDPHKWEKTEHGLSQRRRSPKFQDK